jgi:hypothetical protein
MQRHQILKSSFNRVAIMGLFLAGVAGVGCQEDPNYTRHKQDAAIIQQLEQHYVSTPRLKEIVHEQSNMYPMDRDGLTFFVSHNIQLVLSAEGLPNGAAIRLFKDHWQINPYMTLSDQAWTVDLAMAYANGQAKDSSPFGLGESFALGRGTLTPIGSAPATSPQP